MGDDEKERQRSYSRASQETKILMDYGRFLIN